MRTTRLLTAFLITLLVIAALVMSSCSDLNKELPVPVSGSQKVHEEGWTTASSANFHGEALRQTQYKLDECVSCHSKQYTGGVTGVSCMTSGCHVDANNVPKSPEACSTCHGSFSAPANNFSAAAPPRSVEGETDATSRGVGAHQKHLVTGTIGKATRCRECHTVPTQLNAAGHLGALPAEVAFNDTLARLTTAKGSFTTIPSYDASSLKCSNTFCHGSWKLRKATSTSQFAYADSVMVGENFSPTWTGGSSSATCGSCHGLPPKGHIVVPVSTCGTCHDGIVSSDGTITDKTRHVNGKINVFGQEYAF
ncbi:MAG: hypothetical protein A2X66_09385 [Ignavibacteria bacterium GWA2_54_16]|nr:MAG: hypothetical protein A2X66_09385 [Ignavibacteria bacterium GWA2_54_16]